MVCSLLQCGICDPDIAPQQRIRGINKSYFGLLVDFKAHWALAVHNYLKKNPAVAILSVIIASFFSIIYRRPQGGESYYPMEMLKILEGQLVPVEKQSLNYMGHMILQCQVQPANLRQEILKQHVNSMAPASNQYFRAHGIRVDSELLRADAQLLHLPAIQYANDRVEPTSENTCELNDGGKMDNDIINICAVKVGLNFTQIQGTSSN
jgi:hypothetical protein